jgi:hypothetical protein
MADDDDDDRDEQDADYDLELPGEVEDLLEKLEDEAKLLRKENVDLRKYLRDYLVPRVGTGVELLGQGLQETYEMSRETLNQMIGLRAVVLRELKKLGVSIPEKELQAIAPDVDHVTKLYEAIGGLGFILSSKLPDDEDVKKAHNHVVATFLRAFGGYVGEAAPPEESDDDEAPTPRAERERRKGVKPETKVETKAEIATDDRPSQ